MLDFVRDVLYRAMTTPRGDALAPMRIPKDLARRLNATLGRPLAPRDELAQRAAARTRLAELRASGATAGQTPAESAPVLVYFEKDRNVRELTRIDNLDPAQAEQHGWRLGVAEQGGRVARLSLEAHADPQRHVGRPQRGGRRLEAR